MALVRFNPMRELFEVEKEFNKLFGDFDKRFGFNNSNENDREMDAASWAPLTDVYEDNDGFKLKLDLPGVSKNEVKISYSNGHLVISGERKQEAESDNHKYHRIERSYGKFYRSFDLPKEVDESKISAEFKNGQLILEIPKSEKAKPRVIEVSVK
ncbi:MAG: heat-shock protein [Ignavibacteriae bacterium HGW-Ignavibacteriae-2]|jgi:HSP20 family protein|nr:Hsp20/alpha crystallin family protein [Bacteroidota bacterium]PKL87712.1 MAG: heat-shock protein [Ignavibacteriae bacterium HGW-Ignavibacteriae-2]